MFLPAPYRRPVGAAENALSADAEVRYLLQPGESEGGVRRATDPIWSLETFELDCTMIKQGQPVLYSLRDGPKRSFVREEFMVVPPNTELPPSAPD